MRPPPFFAILDKSSSMAYNSNKNSSRMNEPMKMRMYPHPYAAMDHEKRQRFLEFIHEVSPSADPKSVILFGQIMRAKNYLTQAAEKHLGGAGLSDAKFRMMVNLHRAETCGTQYMQPSE